METPSSSRRHLLEVRPDLSRLECWLPHHPHGPCRPAPSCRSQRQNTRQSRTASLRSAHIASELEAPCDRRRRRRPRFEVEGSPLVDCRLLRSFSELPRCGLQLQVKPSGRALLPKSPTAGALPARDAHPPKQRPRLDAIGPIASTVAESLERIRLRSTRLGGSRAGPIQAGKGSGRPCYVAVAQGSASDGCRIVPPPTTESPEPSAARCERGLHHANGCAHVAFHACIWVVSSPASPLRSRND